MIVINENSDTSLYMQIYDQFKESIITGELTDGSKLPSTRNLSRELGVSRNTIESAYQQLYSEGYIISKTGSGFTVKNFDRTISADFMAQSSAKPALLCNDASLPNQTYKYDFRYGKLSPEDFPKALWKRLSNKIYSEENINKIMSYNENKGELVLREEIAKYLKGSRGVSCSSDQIVLCSGSQSAIDIICQLINDLPTSIAIEDPGYAGARDVFINNGLNLIPIDVDSEGINIDMLEKTTANIVYVTPSHQFPMGGVMPIQRRLKLIEWAVKNDSVIIEDDYDSELRYCSRPIPSIQSIDPYGRVIYIGTFSKSLAPGLRLSYMVLTPELTKTFDTKFARYHSQVPVLQQLVIKEFMALGNWESHLRKICLSYKKKHDILISMINELMGSNVTIHGKNAGMHIIVEVKSGPTEEDLIKRASNGGVKVYPVSTSWIRKDKYPGNMVLLGFSGLTENNIREGLAILKSQWFN